MRVIAFCPICDVVGSEAESVEEVAYLRGTPIPLRPGAVVAWTCSEGHLSHYWNSAPFYEALFAEGIQKLADDDTRGAVLSLYASWDNFAAYVIRLLVDDVQAGGVVPVGYALAERRLGLYVGLVFARTRQWPEIVSSDAAAIRNKVIHDDKIPSSDEVIKVAESVQKAVGSAKRLLGSSVFESDAKGVRAERRLDEAVRQAGLSDSRAVVVVYESGSLTDTDIRSMVRSMRTGEPLEPDVE